MITAPLRRDTARTRDRLLDAAGELLADRGTAFSLPDLARASGVATATVYRHFASVHDVHREFHTRLIGELVAELNDVSDRHHGLDRLRLIGERWVRLAVQWGRASTRIRRPEGFLERVAAGDPPTSALHAGLAPVVRELVDAGTIPAQDLDYAILLWITVFDERVIADLTAGPGWTPERIATTLTASLLGAWQNAG
ncbi:TetR/AcrR family transcriptional regulator [Actinomadura rayongensis]|uniref:TetR family transcriptional regulator n=1 Tax=Actinomadura rayongensis TaxID=1429076 RepID=A0A6I4W1I8_9ACTN|nr:TetR/AcrR family transcriptional regulator [Actinomadura rayongensis]MXQ63168.1 TetR family transcriptional regulator [Actinomadura rayongensis]